MKNFIIIFMMAFMVFIFSTAGTSTAQKVSPGEKAFVEHCAVCHKDGGNIVNPVKTLQKKSLAANGIGTPNDIVKNMRNPGPAMTRFDKEAIDDKTAQSIAEYILKTFK